MHNAKLVCESRMLGTINSSQACTATEKRIQAGQDDTKKGEKGSLPFLLPPPGSTRVFPHSVTVPVGSAQLQLSVSSLQVILALEAEKLPNWCHVVP